MTGTRCVVLVKLSKANLCASERIGYDNRDNPARSLNNPIRKCFQDRSLHADARALLGIILEDDVVIIVSRLKIRGTGRN